jgi:hypothetical protein
LYGADRVQRSGGFPLVVYYCREDIYCTAESPGTAGCGRAVSAVHGMLHVTKEKVMSVERTLFAFGGTMVMLTCLLALFHHPNWTWVTLFIGFNCLQSSFTGFCPPSWLMKKFGMKTEAELALESLAQ